MIFISYIKFLLKSQNQHGIHSPFVYDLVSKCFYDKKKYPAYQQIDRFRKSLRTNKNFIEITDFGAGSRVFKTNKRQVSALAQNAGISQKRARLLNRLIRYFNFKKALELGTSLGMGTAAMAAGNRINITTIEGCPKTAKIAKDQFNEFGLKNIQLKVGSFEEVLGWNGEAGSRKSEDGSRETVVGSQETRKTEDGRRETETDPEASGPQLKTENLQLRTQLKTHNPQLTTDLVFFDGNHQKQATLDYFYQLLPRAHNESVFIFDDIHWSAEMEEAWEEIKAHPEVRISIDTFYWGLIFFRKEQEKEHFVIRL